ncbi:hypothetical protein [Frondihabitans australicus]|uniref:Uncharacterized protein n=1 Tax=Frondihabitans australicus TaxID=386892 RepID=A0A495IKN1_9MICO|nr:hypothetical protein [Frondihabitans australicus]RKR76527.1 hypothetical protein C8E83_3704 [Frondihabitans australicus]
MKTSSRAWRITSVGGKASYLVAAGLTMFLVVLLLQFGLGDDWGLVGSALSTLLVVGLGTRLFRASAEPVEAPRVWWRMTGRATAGWVLGALFGISALMGAVSLARASSTAVTIVADGLVALAYLNSSWRLSRGFRGRAAQD